VPAAAPAGRAAAEKKAAGPRRSERPARPQLHQLRYVCDAASIRAGLRGGWREGGGMFHQRTIKRMHAGSPPLAAGAGAGVGRRPEPGGRYRRGGRCVPPAGGGRQRGPRGGSSRGGDVPDVPLRHASNPPTTPVAPRPPSCAAASYRAIGWTLDHLYRDGDILHLLHVVPEVGAPQHPGQAATSCSGACDRPAPPPSATTENLPA
jgi:hypothetical protein